MCGANVIKETHSGDSPLLLAIQKGRVDLVDMLVRAGAEVNLANNISGKKLPPLNMAVQSGQAEAVRYLIRAGADVNTAGSHKFSVSLMPEVFSLSIYHRHTSTQKSLLTC